jgi:hypothetical protein
MGIFPVWVLVVLSIIIYDGIRKPSTVIPSEARNLSLFVKYIWRDSSLRSE